MKNKNKKNFLKNNHKIIKMKIFNNNNNNKKHGYNKCNKDFQDN
jgi:hypothetical protein